MVQVPKDQFYAMIGQLERVETSATMHHHPERKLRWRLQQWRDGEYEELAVSETLLDTPYPYVKTYSVDQRLIDEFITF